MNKIKEIDMVDIFIKMHGSTNNFYKEVPVFAKSVDLVKIDNEENALIAIEFKTNNWRKAELQALGSAIAFDYLEICLLKPATNSCQNVIINECKKQGLGLYFMSIELDTIEHIVKPLPRKEIWEIQRKLLREYLSKRGRD